MWRKLAGGLPVMSDNIRVAVAAIFGAGSPTATWFVEVEPTLKVVLLLGQISVAVATSFYIWRKWRNARAAKTKSKK